MKLPDVFGILEVNEVPNASFNKKISSIYRASMGWGEGYEQIHPVFKLGEMLHGLPNNYASKGIPDEVDPLIRIIGVHHMLFYLGR